jgi:hypothetical protein
MARNETVNIDNIEDLLTVFDNIKCPIWAMLSGTQLLTSYSGSDIQESRQLLEQSAELFAGSSAGRYTLAIYKNLKPDALITNKTEYTNSINFRLNDSQVAVLGQAGYQERYGGRTSKDAINELAKLYQRNSELQAQLIEARMKVVAPPPESTMDKINGVIEGLGLTEIMPHIALRIADIILPPKAGATALSGPTNSQAPTTPGTDTERQAARNEMSEALGIMEEVVPDLSRVMMKFARFSQSNPPQFQLYINAIRQNEG